VILGPPLESTTAPGGVLDRFEAEVRDGLPGSAARRREQQRQLAYYEMRGADLIRPRPAEGPADFEARPKVCTRIARRVVNELAKGLYAQPPTRALPGPAGAVYDRAVVAGGRLDALLLAADRLSWLHGAFAIQIEPTGDPARPVMLYPWRADEFEVFFTGDDPSAPAAVCVVSVFEDRKQVRYQLWDAVEVRTYWTEVGDTDPIGRSGRRVRFDPSASAEHGLGVLPFVFLHAEPPVQSFWCSGGLGKTLADLSKVIDEQLSDLSQAVQVHCLPRTYAENVRAIADLHVPGSLLQVLPSDQTRDARIFHAQPDLQVAEVWSHVLNLANQCLQDLDLPLIAMPEAWSNPESGVAIVARRMPLIDLWRSRRPQWVAAEQRLAAVALAVAGSPLADPSTLTVVFPEPALPLPTPERAAADRDELELGTKSLIQLVQERYGLTRAQAIERLQQVAEDRVEVERILSLDADANPEPDEPDADESINA
jgi:hypothetical protein